MAVAAIAAGAIRGYVVVLSERDGYLYQHSTWIGIAVWAAVLVVRLTLDVAAHVAGAAMAEGTAPLLLSLALLLAVQNGVIALRGLDAGLSFAPRRRGAVRA